MHEFYARKDADGRVRIWMRMSSQASSWLPEGPGFDVFGDNLPIGIPSLAPVAKTDAHWGRTEVEGTVRTWCNFIKATHPGEAVRMREEWDARFASLPPGGDTNSLPEHMKPLWVDLPRCTAESNAASTAAAAASEGVTGGLENPTVNPITGPGRSSADVQRELMRHKQGIRSSCPDALFQGDYLFAQLPGKSLELYRVVHNLLIDDATCRDISVCLGAYTHTHQPGVNGFWGTFAQQANPLYDPKDPRKGTKFVRQSGVTRDEIKLYGVETFISKEKVDGELIPFLRVKASSLERLSAAIPHLMMPPVIPASHVLCAGRGRGGGHSRGDGHSRGGGRGRGRGRSNGVCGSARGGGAGRGSAGGGSAHGRDGGSGEAGEAGEVSMAEEEDLDVEGRDDREEDDAEGRDDAEVEDSEEHNSEDAEAAEDIVAHIPKGFIRADWVEGTAIKHFMLWCACSCNIPVCVCAGGAQWCVMRCGVRRGCPPWMPVWCAVAHSGVQPLRTVHTGQM